jgi:hypothetical protein
MGTWGSGLMEGDGPLDCIGDLAHQIEQDIAGFAKADPSETMAARLGAALGLLLQVSIYSFESDFARTLKKVLSHHSKSINRLSEDAKKIFEEVAGGNGPRLARGTRVIDERLQTLLGRRWAMDTRQTALFHHPEAIAYVQSFAEKCGDIVDEGFQGEDLDLYEVNFMGACGLLLVIAPIQIDGNRIARWRDNLRRVHDQTKVALSKPINQANQADLPFFEEYMTNAAQAFDLILSKIN